MLVCLYSFFSISTVFSDAHCDFVGMPENVAGKIGEVVVINCASNDTNRPCGNLVWARQSPKTLEQIYITRQDKLSDLVSKYIAFTDSSNGNCNLKITMQESAEGAYKCIEAETSKAVTAQLIVLGLSSFQIFKLRSFYFT